MSIVALLGSPNLTMGQGCKTGVSLLIPTMGRGGKTGVSFVWRSGMLQQMVRADSNAIGVGLRELGSGGFGGGWTLLGPDLTSQFPDRYSLIQAFMFLVKFSAGILLAFTWLSLFLRSKTQYFWRNQRGQQWQLSFHFGCLLACLLAKLIAHVSVDSMQSSGWGALFLTMALSSFFFFFLRLSSSLPLLSFLLDAEVLVAVAATAMAGSFIWKVGGRLIWKDPNKTCKTTGMKLMVLSSTSLQFLVFRHCMSQIWKCKLMAKRNLEKNCSSRRSRALKVDLLQSIIVWRVRRHFPRFGLSCNTEFETLK
jgi:hypothetical protein